MRVFVKRKKLIICMRQIGWWIFKIMKLCLTQQSKQLIFMLLGQVTN